MTQARVLAQTVSLSGTSSDISAAGIVCRMLERDELGLEGASEDVGEDRQPNARRGRSPVVVVPLDDAGSDGARVSRERVAAEGKADPSDGSD